MLTAARIATSFGTVRPLLTGTGAWPLLTRAGVRPLLGAGSRALLARTGAEPLLPAAAPGALRALLRPTTRGTREPSIATGLEISQSKNSLPAESLDLAARMRMARSRSSTRTLAKS